MDCKTNGHIKSVYIPFISFFTRASIFHYDRESIKVVKIAIA